MRYQFQESFDVAVHHIGQRRAQPAGAARVSLPAAAAPPVHWLTRIMSTGLTSSGQVNPAS